MLRRAGCILQSLIALILLDGAIGAVMGYFLCIQMTGLNVSTFDHQLQGLFLSAFNSSLPLLRTASFLSIDSISPSSIDVIVDLTFDANLAPTWSQIQKELTNTFYQSLLTSSHTQGYYDFDYPSFTMQLQNFSSSTAPVFAPTYAPSNTLFPTYFKTNSPSTPCKEWKCCYYMNQ